MDEFLSQALGATMAEWGICTECGLGRAERDEVPGLLDLHRDILARYRR